MSPGPALPFTNQSKVSARYYLASNSMVVPLQSHIWRWNRQAQESQWSSLLGNNDHLTKVHIWRQGLWAVMMMMWLLVGWLGWRRCNNGDIFDNGPIWCVLLKWTHSLLLTDAVSIDKAMASCDVVEGGDYDTAIMVTHVKMTEKDPIWCWGRSVL